MIDSMLLKVIIVIVLGISAQWLAWRFRLPAIVIMSVTGLLVGPGLRIVNPIEDFGAMYDPIISIAVAIVLFEGSLNLHFKEIRGLGRPITRIVTIGSLIRWLLGAFAAYFIAGLSWPVSFVISALFIVTGPTVILPLLRQAKLKSRPSKILKWEGIIIDPIGALLAVLAYQVVLFLFNNDVGYLSLLVFFVTSGLVGVMGYLIAKVLGWLLVKGYVPEFIKSPIMLAVVITTFTISDLIMEETGLLAVTVMGITLANLNLPAIQDMRAFKENVSTILISAIFVMLTASIARETLHEIMNIEVLGYVAVMLFIIRPLAIYIATIRTDLQMKEKILLGWIAPRGIVALTVANYFAALLIDQEFEGAEMVSAITFALVFGSVCLHGFSLGWLARKLGLAMEGKPSVLLVGSNPFTVKFGGFMKEMGIPVLLVDTSKKRLKSADDHELPYVKTEILAAESDGQFDKQTYDYLISATETESYNALVSSRHIEEFGRRHVFKLNTREQQDKKSTSPIWTVSGEVLFSEEIVIEELIEKVETGYQFKKTHLTEAYSYDDFRKDRNTKVIPLFNLKPSGKLQFFTDEQKVKVETEDVIISLEPPA
ncbi:sodium:proton antiporter [Virgibacillus sp. C22-A2]|uniref:Sodium:proton antiporter n=1 Tax=Virgibacillus tibetensis TaxID=3042313 RepID=A0ABU6KJA6_9BACI|nr:sodium:proton antiporter [Virgibacillus sp. C22-A2]